MIDPEKTTELLWSRLSQLKTQDELVALVYSQLASDFERAGTPVPFDASLDPKLWGEAIHTLLEQLPAHAQQQLIYITDLPETLVFALRTTSDYLQQLADAIVYRELVKVYYKITYSG